MNEIIKELTPALVSIAATLLSALAVWLGRKARVILDTQEKRAIVEATVKYVEQVGRSLGSEEKLALAQKKALEWLNSKGLPIGDAELNILIEAAVNDFFAHYNLPIIKPEITE